MYKNLQLKTFCSSSFPPFPLPLSLLPPPLSFKVPFSDAMPSPGFLNSLPGGHAALELGHHRGSVRPREQQSGDGKSLGEHGAGRPVTG